jgi:hypothetical protein
VGQKIRGDVMSDFWGDMQGAFVRKTAMDRHLEGRELEGSYSTSMRDLTDAGRQANSLRLPQDAGTRVRFAMNIGAILTYDDIPADRLEGTIVTVRTGSGDTTHMDGNAFVLWDDGKLRAINAEHLRLAKASGKKASTVRMRVADLGDIAFSFSRIAGHDDDLIHKATKDIWSFHKDGDGYVIERLFKETGEPLKV